MTGPSDAPLILAVNPGSTTSQYGLFRGAVCLGESDRPTEGSVEAVVAGGRRVVADLGHRTADLAAVIARGGLLRAVAGGVYEINDALVRDCLEHRYGRHAANLGPPAARMLAEQACARAFIADPPTTDELCDEARLTGLPEIGRRSIFHALNHKAVAAALAADLGTTCAAAHLVVVHMGGGLSVGAHLRGRVVDVNDALEGDGPFALNRSGGLPALAFVRWAQGKPADEVTRAVCKTGGLLAHLGTQDGREIERRVQGGDARATAVFEAFAYNIAKAVAALAVPLEGRVDGIGLTGGLARWQGLVDRLRERLAWLAPVHAYPGTREIPALAAAALSVLTGERRARAY
ncbi:MAG: butyrate kinase [Candidatus Brocadiaceae bacterium]|nr:butyrate kinase [Candidatus Brocadiaceae bacterium]